MISCFATGSRHIQFILVERVSVSDESSLLQLVMPGERRRLLPGPCHHGSLAISWNQIFDIWIRRDVERVIVQMFEVALAAGWANHFRVHSPTCGHAWFLESNGDLYNCDHLVFIPEHKLGNIPIIRTQDAQ